MVPLTAENNFASSGGRLLRMRLDVAGRALARGSIFA
jgi:hypothetical protein